jgi:ferrous iron transport protein B
MCESPGGSVRVILVGAPNSGKTTLYNWLTGSRAKVVNYPGSTVDYQIGTLAGHWRGNLKFAEGAFDDWHFFDTPGTHSLSPNSEDERVTLQLLRDSPTEKSLIVLVVDGTQLERFLPLALHLKDLQVPFVLAVTMMDELKKISVSLNRQTLSASLGAPVVEIQGLLGGGIAELLGAIQNVQPQPLASLISENLVKDFSREAWEKILQRAKTTAVQALSREMGLTELRFWTQKIDTWVLHPWLGPSIFLTVMILLFASIFWLAAPVMDVVDQFFSWLGHLAAVGLGEGLLGQFTAQGVIPGFAAVLVFVPQIFILFVGIGALESSGYLARAATLIDRPLSAFGLSGRSFVPLLSGFACAVPAMMATRNLSSRRERWIVNFIIPLMTCSARLPVYSLLLAFLFWDKSPWIAGTVLAAIYLFSLFLGGLAAGLLHTILPQRNSSFLMMDLPVYRRPRLRGILWQSFSRALSYVKRAGPVIFLFALLIWLGTTFPRVSNPSSGSPSAASSEAPPLSDSYLGRAGQIVEPIFSPMGADWRVGVSLLSAFAAREVFVSSLGVILQIEQTPSVQSDGGEQEQLLHSMVAAKRADGSPLFTVASVAALIVFFMVALQCMSTVAIAIKESGSWQFALGQLVIFTLGAYLLAVLTYQTLRLFF